MQVPDMEQLYALVKRNGERKRKCFGQLQCKGYNSYSFTGNFGRCRQELKPFCEWEETIRNKRYKETIDGFVDQFYLKEFELPCKNNPQIQEVLNKFFAAKYGLFTCYDDYEAWGQHKYMPRLIRTFERKEENIKTVWYTAIMVCLQEGVITWEQMEKKRKHHKQTKAFLKELRYQYKLLSARLRKEELEQNKVKMEEKWKNRQRWTGGPGSLKN